MKHHVSRLKIFDMESMSDCTSQVTDVRATERISQGSTRLLQGASFRKLEAPAKASVSDYGPENLWGLVAGNPEQDELVNTRLRARTSKKHLHLACNWLV